MTITAPMVKFFGKGNEARGYLVTMTIYGIAAMLIFFVTLRAQKKSYRQLSAMKKQLYWKV